MTAPTVEPSLRDTDAPVFDADSERESDKNLRIAKEIFADDDDDDSAPVAVEPPKAAPKAIESPPAQRRREAAAAEPEKVERTPVEDARGRLHRANGTVMSNEEAAAYRAQSAQPDVAAEPEAQAAPVIPNEPLEFMAYGQPITLEGSLYKPGHGCFVPEARMGELRQYIARGHRYASVVAENEKLRSSSTSLYTQREAQADAVLDVVAKTFKDPQMLQEFMAAFQQNPQLAFREMQIAIREKELTLQAQVQQPDAPGDTSVDPAEIAEAFTDELQDFFTDPRYGLTGQFTVAEQKNIRNVCFQKAHEFTVVVDRDLDSNGDPIVNSHQKVSIRKGEMLVNRGKLLSELRYAAQYKSGGAPAPAAPATAGVQSTPPVTRQAPPSAVGRSRAQVPSAPQPGTGKRVKDTIPNHSITAAANYLFGDD